MILAIHKDICLCLLKTKQRIQLLKLSRQHHEAREHPGGLPGLRQLRSIPGSRRLYRQAIPLQELQLHGSPDCGSGRGDGQSHKRGLQERERGLRKGLPEELLYSLINFSSNRGIRLE